MHGLELVRRASRLVLASGIVVLAACGGGDGPVEPPQAKLNVASGNAQQGQVSTLLSGPISVRVTDAAGKPLSGVAVTWAVTSGGGSVAPATSVTNADGIAQTQWTLGPSAGQQTVTASANGASAVFTATASSIPDCGASLTLGVGQLCLASPSRAASVEVNAGTAASEFVAIAYYDGNFLRQPTAVSVSTTGAIGVSGPPNPALFPSFLRDGVTGAAAMSVDYRFERRLRARERELVGRGASRRGAWVPLLSMTGSGGLTPTAPRYAVGDIISLNANAEDDCTNPITRPARVVNQSAHAIIVEDTGNPPGGFTDADYSEISSLFETLIWPVDSTAFGAPTDIDNNQRVIIFYTAEVNRLSTPGSGSFVGGFFYSRDLFKKTPSTTPTGWSLQACPSSNVAEMFYVLAPDPGSPPMFGNRWSVAEVKRITVGTIGHELQHLINSSRRLYITQGARPRETTWLDEGLSHIAEELIYFRASGFAPRQNLDLPRVRASEDLLAAVNSYQVSNLSRFSGYLRVPNTQSPYGETNGSAGDAPPADQDDLATRGAIWSFLRWAADHRGSSDGDVWNKLVMTATDTGAANLEVAFGANIGARFRDWAAANYLDDAVTTGNVAFEHPSWNFRSVLAGLSGNNSAFPLVTFVATDATPLSFSMVDGGAAYVRFGIAGGGKATVRITSGGGTLPSGASVYFVRTK